MTCPPSSILSINGGSSSIRFAVYHEPSLSRHLSGKIDRIGLKGMTMSARDAIGAETTSIPIPGGDYAMAVAFLLHWLSEQPCFPSIRAVGHRVVHGMNHPGPVQITPRMLEEWHRNTPDDPDHLPQEIMLIEAFGKWRPDLPRIACFDTSFHRNMPRVAKLLPIPRRYSEKGIMRCGFHGLSYAYLMEELGRLDPLALKGRVILAHLGSGASLAAVRNGESIDTSMGFTPASGLVMGTRSGDLDPGLFSHLTRTEEMTGPGFQKMVNKESGMLGISETSSDVRDLLAIETTDVRAGEAVALFCYQAKKWIGAFAAALGGLDTLVFTGGIGENSPVIRGRICAGLEFLGLTIDEKRNAVSAGVISSENSRATVRVISTEEELMIARAVRRVLGPAASKSRPL